ncbi:tyrosine-type recombinase/integrase [Carbonactinospora thermoautotrophica]|uniref:tyrosine-type recombinase/integrase n=1 Tax=Carbonactinospora thermoautotrophica TaxID=1469144 RepID=UPI00226D90C3|nr:tyrosine-type recombinase/integrase [Carbonactinospora thermoautotrophica]
MTSENAYERVAQDPESTSENTQTPGSRRRGARGTPLPGELAAVLADYLARLERAPLSTESRRTYASKVRQYLAWLAAADVDGDPLADPAARDWAVRDYRTHLVTVAKRKPTTVNNALAALDDFYTRRGLGPANADRLDLPTSTRRSLPQRAQTRWLRAVAQEPSARDRALALLPFYAGPRIAETVRLDLDDVRLSARKGELRLLGKGGKPRWVPLHPELRAALAAWLEERRTWPGAQENPALFLNRRGGRLSVRGARDVFARIADAAGLDAATAHALRHTFATTLVRGGTDLVIVAELLGHARLETTRGYTRPSAEDRERALDLLPVDR